MRLIGKHILALALALGCSSLFSQNLDHSLFDKLLQKNVNNGLVDNLEIYSNTEKGVMKFVIHYLPEADQEYILRNQPKIEYIDYDWSLNEK
jgi:hypothetical protein